MTDREHTAPQGSTALGAGHDGAGHGPARERTVPVHPAADRTSPDYTTAPVVLRRPDALAALLLLLAGIAAGISLLLPWLVEPAEIGLDLLDRGIDAFGTGPGELLGTGMWQPLTVVAAGAALLVLGLLMFVPARTHRFLGVLALVLGLAAAAAVLVPLSSAGWDVDGFDIGFWFAVAVPALGLLGGAKAALTGPTSRA